MLSHSCLLLKNLFHADTTFCWSFQLLDTLFLFCWSFFQAHWGIFLKKNWISLCQIMLYVNTCLYSEMLSYTNGYVSLLPHLFLKPFLLQLFIYMCMCAHMPWHLCGGQRKLILSHTCVLGSKLRLSASAFIFQAIVMAQHTCFVLWEKYLTSFKV